jgi:hypothetical protein
MPMTDSLDVARRESALSSGAGFPFLLCFGVTWILAAVSSFVVAQTTAAWIHLLQGVVVMPVAVGLQRLLGYPRASRDNPLMPLAAQIVFIQPVAFPAFIVVLVLEPAYVPVAFAAVVAAHFLPFGWLYRTPVYVVLGVVLSAGVFGLAAVFGLRSLHYTGFFVGACLLVAAFFARAHAAALRRQTVTGTAA